jgi:hypothetical protein
VKKLAFLVVLALISASLLAGNNDKNAPHRKTVSGKVTTFNGEEIPAVKITIKETNESFYSDLDGHFNFTISTDKAYSVKVETIGYQALELRSTELHAFSEINLKELR